jgi:hypothetical protein
VEAGGNGQRNVKRSKEVTKYIDRRKHISKPEFK